MNKQGIALLVAGIGLLRAGPGLAEPIDALHLRLDDSTSKDRPSPSLPHDALPRAVEKAAVPAAGPDAGLSLRLTDHVTTPRTEAAPSENQFKHPNTLLTAGYTVMRDSNFFRLSSRADPLATLGAPQKDETIRSVDAGVEWHTRLDRQLVILKAEASRNDFEHFDNLSYTGHAGAATWNGEMGTRWSGTADYSVARTLGSMADVQSISGNLLDRMDAALGAGYLVDPRWQLRVGANRHELTHLADSRKNLDREENSASVAMHYLGTGSGGRVTALANVSDVHFPRAPDCAIACDYRLIAASLSAAWPLTGITQLDAQLGYTRVAPSSSPDRDFTGPTGHVTMHWRLAGKTTTDLSAWREITAIEDLSANYIVNQGWSLSPNWAATDKIGVQGRYVSESRNYRGAASAPGLDPQNDNVRKAGVGLSYKAARHVELSLAYDAESRRSNRALRDYQFEQTTLNVRANF